ncbi:hypothetical protein [Pelagicoccus mobilis]|uniref:Uncharacterized protein n=1 Tax=Pelagicoccus mobilis TaxID=415221 RepID=A0A934RVS0_9BACT|nr:hypothetical protein [Pelagicoccus mobilis]MBK1878620.1 hypothetical protein [Pelagicoccus mobilis]
MKHIRIPKLATLAIVVLATSLFSTVSSAQDASVSATLILASNEGQGVDASLKQYERRLIRAFPFDTFKQQGTGNFKLRLNGTQTISFPGGQKVTVSYLSNEGGKYRLSAQWKKDSKTLTDMTVLASKGHPTVQAAGNSGGKLPLLILVVN